MSAQQLDPEFMKRLKKMEPLEKSQIKVDLIKIDSKEEPIEALDDIWLNIDSKALRKNRFFCSEERPKTKDLSQILYTILKIRFLIPISNLSVDYHNILKGNTNTYFGKILITDDKSREILSHIIDPKSMKEEPIGISSDYNLRDALPQEFKRKYHLIYLICLNEISDEEFNHFHNSLVKESQSQTVFSFYILLDSDQRIKKLEILRQKSNFSGVFQLGGFQCIDHNIVVVDNNPNMNWLTKINQFNEKVIKTLVESLSQRLVNFLEQMGEFPTVIRYYKSFHLTNKLIADRVLKELTEIANQRAKSFEKKHESNFELLIVDRTIDLITPLTHCLQFRPFVFNELEKHYENDVNKEYRKLNRILVNNTLQLKESFDRIKSVHFRDDNAKDEVLIQKTNRNIENASEVFNKIKSNSFSHLLAIEKSLLETKSSLKLSKDLRKRFKKLFKETDREVTINDLNRVLIINGLFAKSQIEEDIKQFVEKNQKEQIDLTVIHDFIESTKKFVNIEEYSSTDTGISKIVSKFFEGILSEEKFPSIHRKRFKDKNQKLILFILGGLSYNDLKSIPNKYQNNVIFCANGLITPKMFIDSIIYE